VAESPAARRERIAETIYAAMIASPAWCDNTNADLAWEARKAADAFLSSAPEQPHPPAEPFALHPASAALLEAAKIVVATWQSPVSVDIMDAACNQMRDAIEREEARRG
jgi:hypothetical protein